ncbi:erythropoietin receptor [Erpetoichthys calabaricus]|uniref:erythropoietin receptor n=1 Tax=Erpetoichthys calabaricus TaxID=27687 RepID=UPI0022349F24|nr:erythropoietin receptor [Erpetoichthys calabaricus]
MINGVLWFLVAWSSVCFPWDTQALELNYNDAVESKAAVLLAVEPEDPKCFTEDLKHLICFWDESSPFSTDSFSFYYKYENEDACTCNLTLHRLADNKTRYLCFIYNVFSFTLMDIVVNRGNAEQRRRQIYVDQVVLLDPPTNVTVIQTGKAGQLYVKWLQKADFIHSDVYLKYEVSYAPLGSDQRKTVIVNENKYYVLNNLKPWTRYVIHIRSKLDSQSFNGSWSAWSREVSLETPSDVDPLILSLSLILLLILLVLFITTFLSHRRFLLKKMWPLIPTPENKFAGLFTVYKGNFQEWLGHSNAYLWWSPTFLYFEDVAVSLEVLSEIKPILLPTSKPVPAKPSKNEQYFLSTKEEEKEQGSHILSFTEGQVAMNELKDHQEDARTAPWPFIQSNGMFLLESGDQAPLESKDVYVTLNQSIPLGHSFVNSASQLHNPGSQDVLEEERPLQTLFSTASCEGSDKDSAMQNRHSHSVDRVSSGSSFDYAVYDPSGDRLYPRTWPTKNPDYNYMTMADSGISVDYSPMDFCSTGVIREPSHCVYSNI